MRQTGWYRRSEHDFCPSDITRVVFCGRGLFLQKNSILVIGIAPSNGITPIT